MKKVEPPEYFITIEWSQEAKEMMLGQSFLKNFVYRYKGMPYGQERYSKFRREELEKFWIIKDDTEGQRVPADSTPRPVSDMVLGRIQLNRRLPL